MTIRHSPFVFVILLTNVSHFKSEGFNLNNPK
jgi:hypothetical protein